MTYDEVVALEHENWIAYVTGVVSCTSRSTLTHVGGVVTVLTGLPCDWFNQDPDEVISLFSSGFDAPYTGSGPSFTEVEGPFTDPPGH